MYMHVYMHKYIERGLYLAVGKETRLLGKTVGPRALLLHLLRRTHY